MYLSVIEIDVNSRVYFLKESIRWNDALFKDHYDKSKSTGTLSKRGEINRT